MTNHDFEQSIRKVFAEADFAMLRYETEHTPCTGITAVTKQERRHYDNGVMIAPWCPCLKRTGEDPLVSQKVREMDWTLKVHDRSCRVLATTDKWVPIIFLAVDGCFQGVENPYDTYGDRLDGDRLDGDRLAELKRDALYFGLAVDALLKEVGARDLWIWGADWETCPALWLLRDRYEIALTLHNTFDESLSVQADTFGEIYWPFCTRKDSLGGTLPSRTALQVGLDHASVVTTVNKGFARGMRTEPIQTSIMADHIQNQIRGIVGIDNAEFTSMTAELVELKRVLRDNLAAGKEALFAYKAKQLAALPEHIKSKAAGKVIIVSMGRRVAQKQHDVLVESLRTLLKRDRDFPVLAIFATVHGDGGSAARLERIRELADEFPLNVVCEDGLLGYYQALMGAADFNCMPSLYEPHGGAYEGTVIPIARAVDGLLAQVCAMEPQGYASLLNAEWHRAGEDPTGFLFREPKPLIGFTSSGDMSPNMRPVEAQLRALISISPSPENEVFWAMCEALTDTLFRAVMCRCDRHDDYARLVLAALEKQGKGSWKANLGGMLALIERVRITRIAA